MDWRVVSLGTVERILAVISEKGEVGSRFLQSAGRVSLHVQWRSELEEEEENS